MGHDAIPSRAAINGHLLHPMLIPFPVAFSASPRFAITAKRRSTPPATSRLSPCWPSTGLWRVGDREAGIACPRQPPQGAMRPSSADEIGRSRPGPFDGCRSQSSGLWPAPSVGCPRDGCAHAGVVTAPPVGPACRLTRRSFARRRRPRSDRSRPVRCDALRPCSSMPGRTRSACDRCCFPRPGWRAGGRTPA